jgi:hypothetical protein
MLAFADGYGATRAGDARGSTWGSLKMETEEDRRRWRAALKEIGASNVAQRLNRIDPLHPEQPVPPIGERPPWPTRGFIEQWLREQEAAIQSEETRRYRRVLTWTIVAAVAGAVAAVASIIAIFRG